MFIWVAMGAYGHMTSEQDPWETDEDERADREAWVQARKELLEDSYS